MESVILTVQTFDVINDILNTITGYGSDRKVNFTTELSEEEYGKLKVSLTYNDTQKVIFEGVIIMKDMIEAIKSEDAKEKDETEDIEATVAE